MKRRRKRKSKSEFSKRWVAVIMTASLIDLNILIFMDRMENLAIAIVTEIIAVSLGYFAKAYLGKRNEETNRIIEEYNKEDLP